MSRWILYDEDFYEEIVPFGSDLEGEEEEEEAITCRCYGRGKSKKEVEVPRVPELQFKIEKQRYMEKMRPSLEPKSRRLGRGRARIRQNVCDKELMQVGQSKVTVSENPQTIPAAGVSNFGQQTKSGGFGRPRFPTETLTVSDYDDRFTNVQPTRREFSIEDFISASSKKKKRKNKTSTGSTLLTSSTDPCTSPENNEAMEISEAASTDVETAHEIDGYLLSKMLNISCPEGEKMINTQGIKDSLSASSLSSALDMLDAFDNFEDVHQEKIERRKKTHPKQFPVLDTEEEDNWVLMGRNVVEVSDLPADCDITLLRDLVAAYGSILESDMISKQSTLSVRYQLDSDEAADWVVSNLHNADYLFPDCCVTCKRV